MSNDSQQSVAESSKERTLLERLDPDGPWMEHAEMVSTMAEAKAEIERLASTFHQVVEQLQRRIIHLEGALKSNADETTALCVCGHPKEGHNLQAPRGHCSHGHNYEGPCHCDKYEPAVKASEPRNLEELWEQQSEKARKSL